jgi:hypothetical protein
MPSVGPEKGDKWTEQSALLFTFWFPCKEDQGWGIWRASAWTVLNPWHKTEKRNWHPNCVGAHLTAWVWPGLPYWKWKPMAGLRVQISFASPEATCVSSFVILYQAWWEYQVMVMGCVMPVNGPLHAGPLNPPLPQQVFSCIPDLLTCWEGTPK